MSTHGLLADSTGFSAQRAHPCAARTHPCSLQHTHQARVRYLLSLCAAPARSEATAAQRLASRQQGDGAWEPVQSAQRQSTAAAQSGTEKQHLQSPDLQQHSAQHEPGSAWAMGLGQLNRAIMRCGSLAEVHDIAVWHSHWLRERGRLKRNMDAVNVSALVTVAAKQWDKALSQHSEARKSASSTPQVPLSEPLPSHSRTQQQQQQHAPLSSTVRSSRRSNTHKGTLLHRDDMLSLGAQLLHALHDLVHASAPSFFPRQHASVAWGLAKLATSECAESECASAAAHGRRAGRPSSSSSATAATAVRGAAPHDAVSTADPGSGSRASDSPGGGSTPHASPAALLCNHPSQHAQTGQLHPASLAPSLAPSLASDFGGTESLASTSYSSISTLPGSASSPFPALLSPTVSLVSQLTCMLCTHPRFRTVVPRDAAQVLYAHAQLMMQPEPQHAHVLLSLLDTPTHAFSPQDCAMLCYALGKLQLCPEPHQMRNLVQLSTPILRNLTPQGLANTAWGLAVLRFQPNSLAWERACVEAAAKHMGAFSHQELANFVWALPALGIHPPKAWMLCLEAQVAGRLHALSPQDVSNLMWGIVHLGHRPDPFLVIVVAQEAARWVTPERAQPGTLQQSVQHNEQLASSSSSSSGAHTSTGSFSGSPLNTPSPHHPSSNQLHSTLKSNALPHKEIQSLHVSLPQPPVSSTQAAAATASQHSHASQPPRASAQAAAATASLRSLAAAFASTANKHSSSSTSNTSSAHSAHLKPPPLRLPPHRGRAAAAADAALGASSLPAVAHTSSITSAVASSAFPHQDHPPPPPSYTLWDLGSMHSFLSTTHSHEHESPRSPTHLSHASWDLGSSHSPLSTTHSHGHESPRSPAHPSHTSWDLGSSHSPLSAAHGRGLSPSAVTHSHEFESLPPSVSQSLEQGLASPPPNTAAAHSASGPPHAPLEAPPAAQPPPPGWGPATRPQVLITLLGCCAIFKSLPPSSVLDTLARNLGARLHMCNAADLSSVLAAIGCLRFLPDERWMLRFFAAARVRMPEFSGPQVAAMLHSLAALRVRPDHAWMEWALSQAGAKLQHCKPRDFARLAWALSTLGYCPSSSWLEAFCTASGPALGCCSAKELWMLTCGLAKLNLRVGSQSCNAAPTLSAHAPSAQPPSDRDTRRAQCLQPGQLPSDWVGALQQALVSRAAELAPRSLHAVLVALAKLKGHTALHSSSFSVAHTASSTLHLPHQPTPGVMQQHQHRFHEPTPGDVQQHQHRFREPTPGDVQQHQHQYRQPTPGVIQQHQHRYHQPTLGDVQHQQHQLEYELHHQLHQHSPQHATQHHVHHHQQHHQQHLQRSYTHFGHLDHHMQPALPTAQYHPPIHTLPPLPFATPQPTPAGSVHSAHGTHSSRTTQTINSVIPAARLSSRRKSSRKSSMRLGGSTASTVGNTQAWDAALIDAYSTASLLLLVPPSLAQQRACTLRQSGERKHA